MMVWSILLYLVSVVVPLVVTLETLAIVQSGRHENLQSSPTLILQLKYWSLYGIVFGLVPGFVVRSVLNNLPFSGLLAVVGSSVLTAEVVRNFTKFLQRQDGKYVFLINKLNDSKVSWMQWLRFAASGNGPGEDVFLFGEFTRFWVSLANRLPLTETHYLERCFDELREKLLTVARALGSYLHSRGAGAARKEYAKVAEGYDMLEDVLLDTHKEHLG